MTTATNTLTPLTTLDELTRALDASHARPALFFKHSYTCGTSAQAFEELQALLAGPPLPADLYLIDVRAGRAVSNELAARVQTRHESPQALLVKDGQVRWAVSHFRVTATAIDAAIRQFGL